MREDQLGFKWLVSSLMISRVISYAWSVMPDQLCLSVMPVVCADNSSRFNHFGSCGHFSRIEFLSSFQNQKFLSPLIRKWFSSAWSNGATVCLNGYSHYLMVWTLQNEQKKYWKVFYFESLSKLQNVNH